MKLRTYQEEAVAAVLKEWETHKATLGVAATGSGKTQIFCEVIRRRAGRSLVLAHRKELVAQAVNRLRSFGIDAEIEQGELRATSTFWNRSPVVVATPQTLYSRKFARLQKFRPEDFSTIICDEAHHYCGAPAFEAVVKHFMQNPEARILGVTATPDRTDNIAMANIFESVAFDVEIKDLIELGYLVPVDQRMVRVEKLDLSECKIVAGDLNGGDLSRVLEYEHNMLGIADATLNTVGGRRTVVFATTVKQAERLNEIFNRHKPDSSVCVFGHTTPDERNEVLRKFKTGEAQICVNVGVLTEGYDNPGIEAVVMARPTLSRALYAQMAGRGTRVLPGVLEAVEQDDATARVSAVSHSAKPLLMILDFVGNSGRHKLVTSADILGGNVSEQAIERAKAKVLAKGGGNMLDELALAEAELKDMEERRKRAGLVAKAQFKLTYVDPFDMFKREAQKWQGYRQRGPLSPKQCAILTKLGHNPNDLTPEAGQAIITKHFEASEAQVRCLVKAGYSRKEVALLKKYQASQLIDGLAKNGWKKPEPKEVPF